MRRTIVSLSLAALVAVAAAGCGGSNKSGNAGQQVSSIPSTPESGTFHMGTEPWLGYGPWWIAKDKGLFAKHGLTTQITNFETDDQINAALASGKLDGANIATHTALRLAASGLPISVVMLEDESETADAILAGPGISSISDLKGKKVAFEEGTTSDILLHHALSANGLSIKDVQTVPMAAADVGAALVAGKVQVGVTYEPYISTVLKAHPDDKRIYSAGQDPGLVGDVFVVRNDVLKSKPGQVAAMLRTWGDSVDYLNGNKADGQAIITKAVGAQPGDLTTAFDGVKIYTLAQAESLLHGAYVSKTIVDVKQAATDANLLHGDIDPKTLIATQFIDEVTKS